MTIKDIEAKSGMARANIRFYEAEGLLAPPRGENGYRKYTDGDLATLKRIKLLRMLRVPLDEIKAVMKGDEDLQHALDRHVKCLSDERADIESAKRVCERMLGDGVQFPSLNAQRYLDAFERPTEAARALDVDVKEAVKSPWRRFFARMFDYALFTVLWNAMLMHLFNVNIARDSDILRVLNLYVPAFFMFLLEPLFLALFGATPGKWILGLRVTDADGRRLSVSAARARTFSMLVQGMGLCIPIVQIYTLRKSYRACVANETLPWENYESQLTLIDEKPWRAVVLVFAHVAVCGLFLLAILTADMPRIRGDLTAAAFCANYRRAASYYDIDNGYILNDNGEWSKLSDGVYVINIGGDYAPPNFEFTYENGFVTGVRFRFALCDSEIFPPSLQDQMHMSSLAFGCAQRGYGAFSDAKRDLIELVQSRMFKDFHFSRAGIQAVCDVDYSGYEHVDAPISLLWPKEGEETMYTIDFSISKDQ